MQAEQELEYRRALPEENMNSEENKEIKKFAKQIQIETTKEIASLGVGHIGGALSISDLLAVLYGKQMKTDPKNPSWEERDWFVCSKGHAGPAVYATLALKGFIPMSELETLNRPGTNLPSHCDRTKTPGIDMTTGSLGQGASTAAEETRRLMTAALSLHLRQVLSLKQTAAPNQKLQVRKRILKILL